MYIYTCRPKFTGTSSPTPRPPTTPNASSSPAAATKTVNTPRDQSVCVSPKQTLSKSRKEHKITCSTVQPDNSYFKCWKRKRIGGLNYE